MIGLAAAVFWATQNGKSKKEKNEAIRFLLLVSSLRPL